MKMRSIAICVLGITVVLAVMLFFRSDGASDFSRRWKAAPVEARGAMVDPRLIYLTLQGRTRSDVIKFLGSADSVESDAFIYDLGKMNGPYKWFLWVRFDEDGKVIEVFGDG